MSHPTHPAILLLAISLLAAGDSLSFYAPPAQVDETAGGVDIIVVRTGTGGGAISVDIDVTGGLSGAALGVDFQAASPTTLAWPDGDRSFQVVHVPVLHNPAFAPWHSLAVALTHPTGGAVLDSDMSIVHIPIVEHEPNPAGYLSLLLPDASQTLSLLDDCTGLSVLVARSGGTQGAVSTTVNLVDLSAVTGVDFTAPTDPTLSWADGESGIKSLVIPILARSQARGPLMFSFNIYQLAGGAGLGVPGANVTIIDHLPADAGTASIPATASVSETAGSVQVQIGRGGGSSGAVSLDWAVQPGSAVASVNFSSGSGTLSWADGDTAPKTISIPILADGVPAPNLYAWISYGNPTGGLILPPYAGTSLTITNADGSAGLLVFSDPQVTLRETDGAALLTVSRLGGTTGTVSVDWASQDGSAISGIHYTGGSGTLTWNDGDGADRTIVFPVMSDGTLGPTRAFYVSLSNPTGGAAVDWSDPDFGPFADIVITDADSQAGSIAWLATSVQVHEKAGSVTLTARRSGGSAGPVSVPVTSLDITARLGADYGPGDVATLVWGAGDSADKSLTISVNHDGQPGADRDFRVLLGPASGGAITALPTPATVTILEDDLLLLAPLSSGPVGQPVTATLPPSETTTSNGSPGGGGCGAGAAALLLGLGCCLLHLRRR